MKHTLLLLALFSLHLYAKDSKLELGAGIALLDYSDYIGSNSTRTTILPFPYLEYTSDYLSIDKEGLKKHLFYLKDMELNLSIAGSLPANSEDNTARVGMPNLDFTFEVGAKLSYLLYSKNEIKLYFDTALRAAFSTDIKTIAYQGLVLTPEFRCKLEYNKFEITFRSGVIGANEKYHDYFYAVDKKYETPSRTAYNAKGGYSGFRNKAGIIYRDGSMWYGAFLSHYNLAGAVYEDSPLIETSSAIFTTVSVAYIFYTD